MSGEPPVKRKSTESKKIGTHNGVFHCDESLACFLLKLLPEYKDAEIVRSRDESVLKDCDIVVDVGGVYDPEIHRYDHHQKTFNLSMNKLSSDKPWLTKLSSAGLVYYHFGQQIIAQLLGCKEDDEKAKVVFDKVYENFMEEIDAIDNGIATHDDPPRYRISTNLSSRVSHLVPPWNEPSPDYDTAFHKAVKLTGEEFVDRVKYYGNNWWPARELVLQSLQNRKKVDASGEIIELTSGGYPWKDHLFTLEKDLGIEGEIKFALFSDLSGSWRVAGVPVRPGSFECRLFLTEQWRGLRNEELSSVSGIPGCIFVHASGFIGGNKTRDGALQMAKLTLKALS